MAPNCQFSSYMAVSHLLPSLIVRHPWVPCQVFREAPRNPNRNYPRNYGPELSIFSLHGVTTLRHRRVLRLARCCDELARQINRLSNHGVGCWPTHVANLWSKIGAEGKALFPQSRWLQTWMDRSISWPALLDMAADSRKESQLVGQTLRKERAQAWNQWLRQDWGHGGRAVYKWCKGQSAPACK